MDEIITVLLIGLAAGLISGSMGVGGGIIMVPALVFLLGFTQHEAQGTSLALLTVPAVLPSVYNYYKNGYVNIKVALLLLAAFVVGGYLGSLACVHLSGTVLKKIFAGLMLVMAIKLFLDK